MSLTKEECLFALKSLKPANIYEFIAKGYLSFTEANSILTQLINEHFELVKDFMQLDKDFEQLEKSYDNLYDKFHNLKPLKFEELKEGMWVWDNKYKEYCYIYFIAGKYPHRKYIDNCESDSEFEENRFYRYEVK